MYYEKQLVTKSSLSTVVNGTHSINGALQAVEVSGGGTDVVYKIFRETTCTHNLLLNLYYPSSCYRYHPRVHFSSTAGGAVDVSSAWANSRHIFTDEKVKIITMATTKANRLKLATFDFIINGITSS